MNRTDLSTEQQELLEKLSAGFQRYYNLRFDPEESPFVMEAEFHSLDQQYFLSKSAKLFETESNEYVFFACTEELTLPVLDALDRKAWEEGLSRVQITEQHQCSDVSLVLVAEHIPGEVKEQIRRCKHYKSYALRFRGWSNYRLIALETSTGTITHNRLGESLKKTLQNVI